MCTGDVPPVSYVAIVIVAPLSYAVAIDGLIVGCPSAALTVICPDFIEFADPDPASVTRTFA